MKPLTLARRWHMLESRLIVIAMLVGIVIGTWLEKKSNKTAIDDKTELQNELIASYKRIIEGYRSLLSEETVEFSKALAESHKFSENIGGILKGMAQQAHNLTLKSIAHVQPATLDVIKAQQVNDEATKALDTWETEQQKPEIPDAFENSPAEFLDGMKELLKAGK